jgi:hypothetical protein
MCSTELATVAAPVRSSSLTPFDVAEWIGPGTP